MNYLGHLLLARRTATSPAGAVLGDFVRGADLSAYPLALAEGIRLHRRLDAATDRHPVLAALRETYPPGERRYAGIVLDMALDYALTQAWAAQADVALEAFCVEGGAAIEAAAPWFRLAGARTASAPEFAALLRSYAEPAGIDRALRRIATRLRDPSGLLRAAPRWADSAAALREPLGTLLADLEAEARRVLAGVRSITAAG